MSCTPSPILARSGSRLESESISMRGGEVPSNESLCDGVPFQALRGRWCGGEPSVATLGKDGINQAAMPTNTLCKHPELDKPKARRALTNRHLDGSMCKPATTENTVHKAMAERTSSALLLLVTVVRRQTADTNAGRIGNGFKIPKANLLMPVRKSSAIEQGTPTHSLDSSRLMLAKAVTRRTRHREQRASKKTKSTPKPATRATSLMTAFSAALCPQAGSCGVAAVLVLRLPLDWVQQRRVCCK